MKSCFMKIVVTIFASAGFMSEAFAWGATGHQTVGGIADQLITGTHASKHVTALLGKTTSLATVSVWADCARGVIGGTKQAWQYKPKVDYADCKAFETPSGEQAMVAFVARNAVKCYGSGDDNSCTHKQFHFDDVPLTEDHYDRAFTGTSDHDIVSAIQACVAVLRGKKSPAPFHITTKKEALILLTHYVGDIHQPLHVGAVYLDSNGQEVNPDNGHYDPATKTTGGNSLYDGSHDLHGEWDNVTPSQSKAALSAAGLAEARAVAITSGDPASWAQAWATESIGVARQAFQGVIFGTEANNQWPVTLPANYSQHREQLQHQQLERGGARLAQLLEAIWP